MVSGSQSGSLISGEHSPSIAIAAFTGIGLTSTNSAFIRSSSSICSFALSAKLPRAHIL